MWNTLRRSLSSRTVQFGLILAVSLVLGVALEYGIGLWFAAVSPLVLLLACFVPALVPIALFRGRSSEPAGAAASASCGCAGDSCRTGPIPAERRGADAGSGSPGAAPLACVPGGIPAAERTAHFELARSLFGEAVRERRPLAAGYAFRFPAEELERVRRFVENERRCCPFLTFEIDASQGSVWLRMTGPEGAREMIEAELLS